MAADNLAVLKYLFERNARLAGFPHYSDEVIDASDRACHELANLKVAQ